MIITARRRYMLVYQKYYVPKDCIQQRFCGNCEERQEERSVHGAHELWWTVVMITSGWHERTWPSGDVTDMHVTVRVWRYVIRYAITVLRHI